MQNCLHILGVPRGSSLDDVKTAFRTLSLKYHPDKNPDDLKAPEKFQNVLDAYEYVINHPEVLKISTVSGYALPSYGEPITVSLEAVYLHEKQSITIERTIPCGLCHGTGSDVGKAGSCDTCSGTGKIKGSIARLLDLDPVCPSCHGTGYTGPACSQCGGSKYVKQKHTVEFYVEPKNCIDGVLVLKGVEDVTQSGTYKDFILPIRQDSKYSPVDIDSDGFFRVYEYVSPIEQILSVVKTLKIYGRELRYRVPAKDDGVLVRDMVGKIERVVRVYVTALPPKLTEETKKLYKQILKIEQEN